MTSHKDMSGSLMAVVLRLRCIILEVNELYIYTGVGRVWGWGLKDGGNL